MQRFFDLSEEERRAWGQKTRSLFEEHYQWDKSGKVWEDYFDSVEIDDNHSSWSQPPLINQPSQIIQPPEEWTVEDTSRWLIDAVLGEPDKINSFFSARLTRDLMYGTTTSSTGGMYFNESSAAFDGVKHRQPFRFEDAYHQLYHMANRRNQWEAKRMEINS